MTDHYQTLGVAKNATADEIKRAYRKLASQHHPDRGGDTQKFQEIQAAYDVIGDDVKRKSYDNPQPQFSGFGNFGDGVHVNINDIFGSMFGGHNPFFGQGSQQRRQPSHVRISIWIALADVARGGRRTVAIGTTQGNQTIEIDIPPGVDDGDNVMYQGLAPNGQDLVVQFRVQPMQGWRRDGLTLHTETTASIWTLIMGGTVEVRNVTGESLVVSVPSRCQPGTVLRLRHKGLRNQQGQTGDLMVRLQAQIPAQIEPEIVDAIARFHKPAV
jgi:DnaJ-class molecular chaperone